MKKMNKIYGLNIDMLRLCYEIKEPNNINILRTREIDEEVDFLYFYLRRIEGKHFKFVYEIRYNDLGIDKLFGELRLGINDDKEDSNFHSNGYAKAWISVSNRVLYSDEIYYLDFIEDNLGLELHNITALDLCLDLSCDVARMIRRLIRNKNVTTFLNTKEVKNRNEDRPEITYITSGNMNKDKYLTVSIKQKKAIKDKGKGDVYKRQIYLREEAGVDPETGSALYYDNQQDENGNYTKNKVTDPGQASPIPLKDITPTISGGFMNTFNYKFIDLSFNLSYSFGGYSYDNASYILQDDGYSVISNKSTEQRRRWQKPVSYTHLKNEMMYIF